MSLDRQTQQRLLELVYDLLPAAEAAELRRRIEAEPELAQAHAAAKHTAELFAAAARLPSPKIELQRPEQAMSASPDAPQPQGASRTKDSIRVPRARGAKWTVGLAAAVLAIVSVSVFLYHRRQLSRLDAGYLRVRVTGSADLQAGTEATYAITTTSITGAPMAAQVKLAVCSPGEEPKWHNETTDADGRLCVAVPGDQLVAGLALLKVVAERQGEAETEQFETHLAVRPARFITQLATDKPLYQPGETIYYRSLTLSRFGLAAEQPMPVQFEILDPGGGVVPDSPLAGVTDRGVGNGAFPIPVEAPGGEYTLVARSPVGLFEEQQRPFFVRRYRLPALKKELEFTRDSYAPGDRVVADFLATRAEGGPAADARLSILVSVDGQEVFKKDLQADEGGARQIEFTLPEKIERGDGQLAVIVDDGANQETIAKTIPINLGKVEVTFFPEGGDLVHGLENRVYFVARDPLGEPVHVEGIVVDSGDNEVADVDTTHEGMGSFSFAPRGGEQYRLKITSPADVADEPKLPDVSTRQEIVLSTGIGVFDAGEPLEFNIRATQAGIPLVVSARCRGVAVGQQTLVTEIREDDRNGANAVSIPVADEVGGVIRLTVYDYRQSPPTPVAERLVYRRMGQRLHVAAAEDGGRYAPGETVQLSLKVTDEAGNPVAAVLGVGVVDDALLNLADDDTPGMTTHLLLTSEIEKPEDLEDADFYLSDEPEAAVALDLLLGTQGWRRFVEKTLQELQNEGGDQARLSQLAAVVGPGAPPVMFDNLDAIRSKYEAGLAAYERDHSQVLQIVTTLALFGGLALLLLVAMLGLLRMVSGVSLWVPAAGAAACCVIIGAILVGPDQLRSRADRQVAFCPFTIEPPPSTDATTAPRSSDRSYFWGDFSEIGAADEAYQNLAGWEYFGRLEEGGPAALRWNRPFQERLFRRAGQDGEDGFLGFMEAEGRDKDPAAGWALKFRREDQGGEHFMDDLRFRQGDLEGEELAKDMELPMLPIAPPSRFVVREYAHTLRRDTSRPDVRCDFAETLFWNPLLIAGADGTAGISFQLCDSITTFRLRVDAHGEGRIGSGGGRVISRIPFTLAPKLPLEVTAGDRIDLPLAVANDTDAALPVELQLEHGEQVTLDGSPERKLDLAAGQRGREYFTLDVTGQKGDCALTFHGSARGTGGELADAVSRPLKVVPPGFPAEQALSGQIDGHEELVVELPEQWVDSSLEVALNVFPSRLADLQQGMESMLREPCGCFEQASTSNYPNVLSLHYMQEHDVANPAVTRRAKELLKKGYGKLVGYECPEKGYEWFGGDPGHEALTAYGLMEFRDMAKVYDVDEAMLQRTARWLMDRRDGKGGFRRNAKALDSFGRAPDAITNAYVTWALSESGQEGIEAEVKHAAQLAANSDDPYLIALAAAGALNADPEGPGEELLAKLAQSQAEDGHLEGKQGSITRSGGHSLKVETTALAALAWLKRPAFTEQANRAVEWLLGSRQGSGGFGSTQATILALKALVDHAKANRKTIAAGTLLVQRDGMTIGEHGFGAGQQETIVVEGLEANLKPGANTLTVNLTGDNKMPYALDVRFRTLQPADDPNCPLRLTTGLASRQVKAGQTVALSAELSNTSDEGQPMTIAVLGLPAGLEPRADQLEELKTAGTLDYYETRAREVICYWRCLAPKKKISLKLDLVAAVPGKYAGPASQTYLYYTSEQKRWANPLRIEILR
ncbi:MAG: hypothetical protein JXB62_08680 [Pirellulales bacterium]|nr:hypothetical protein [Pirellulales bacterium]